MRLYYPQIELPDNDPTSPPECISIFIGGFGDWCTGAFYHTMRQLSFWLRPERETRAYYHWDGGSLGMMKDDCLRITDDILAFRSRFPEVPLILCGHSYGASAAMHIARNLPSTDFPIYLLTIDAVSRRQASTRAEGIDYWINCHLTGALTLIDCVPRIGGRWGHCDAADVNMCFDSSRDASDGRPYAHNRPLPLILDATESIPGAAEQVRKLMHNRHP